MRTAAVFGLCCLLSDWTISASHAQPTRARQTNSSSVQSQEFTSDPRDPLVELERIQARRTFEKSRPSLFSTSPLTPLRQRWFEAEKSLYEATNIKIGTAFNHLFQQATESLPGEDQFAMASTMTLIGTWEACNKGEPNQGEVTLGIDGRWGYGPIFPVDLGPNSLGSLGFTANPFGEYVPAFIVRNLFWRQGSLDAGWAYRGRAYYSRPVSSHVSSLERQHHLSLDHGHWWICVASSRLRTGRCRRVRCE